MEKWLEKIIPLDTKQIQRLFYVIQKDAEIQFNASMFLPSAETSVVWSVLSKLSKVASKSIWGISKHQHCFRHGLISHDKCVKFLKKNAEKKHNITLTPNEFVYLSEVMNRQSLDFLIENNLSSLFELVYKNRMIAQ